MPKDKSPKLNNTMMNFAVTIDLKEKIVLNTKLYPTAEELKRLASDEPSKLDKLLEQLLPHF